jgi:hypothetical protein
LPRGIGFLKEIEGMSKGSGRRPAAVSDGVVTANWDRTFSKGERMWRQYAFETTVRDVVVAKSEEEAREMLPPAPESSTGWTLVNVSDA